MLTQAKLQTRQDSKRLRWKLFIVWNNTRLCNLNNKLRETSVLTIKGQPVMLRRRQGRKVSRLVFKHHRGRDDLTTHSNLQHHQPCVMSCKQTTGKGLSRGTISGDTDLSRRYFYLSGCMSGFASVCLEQTVFFPPEHWLCCVRVRAHRCLTWAVAAQHPWLDQGSGDTDVVEETAVLAAGLQPRTRDQHLHTPLRHTNKGLSLTSHTVAPLSRRRCWTQQCSVLTCAHTAVRLNTQSVYVCMFFISIVFYFPHQ